jgi:hypothetical protein
MTLVMVLYKVLKKQVLYANAFVLAEGGEWKGKELKGRHHEQP